MGNRELKSRLRAGLSAHHTSKGCCCGVNKRKVWFTTLSYLFKIIKGEFKENNKQNK